MESIVLIIAAFLTSVLSAIIGMGGGITLLGIMAIIMPTGYLVIAYHGIIQLVSNVTRTAVYRQHISEPIIKRFLIGLVPGLLLSVAIIYGATTFFKTPSAADIKIDFLKPAIGIYIIWFLYLRKKKKTISKEAYKRMGVLAGLATVFIGAMGPLIAPLFINDKLKKESIIATKAACQAAGHLGKMPIFFLFFNVSYIEDWSVLLPLVIAVYAGTKIGKLMLGKLPEVLFQNLFKSVLTLIAIRLIVMQVW
ncbi:MAG: sulfite exporter TauE/SafE family protein [Candidatus Neomarinimicrobiota bacterium]|nr:MAG: sulfite exporter TauE/SafE family protein [bacterium]|tara:strand:- start:418 stop:1170 length:753 start_codon:yes stop_codon:yes gene_type:complete